jgi:penicillin amidase
LKIDLNTHSRFKKGLYISDGAKWVENYQQFLLGPINLVFTTSQGDIGFVPTSLFPSRTSHVAQGSYPKKGWMKENSWTGLINMSDQPHLLNPPTGFIASMNNRMYSERAQHGLTHAMSASARVVRATEMITRIIDSGDKFDFQSTKEMQMDTLDTFARSSTDMWIHHFNFIKEDAYKRFGREDIRSKVEEAIKALSTWDYRFEF